MNIQEIQSALSDKSHEGDTENYLIFRSSGILYGVNANYVTEILTETSVTNLPMVPEHISGIINMRGQIVPIIDFRLLLGREPREDYCTIVLEIEGTNIGILVDSVDQMVAIEKNAILPVPSQHSQRMIFGMCTLPNGGGTLMVLDVSLLLHS